MSAHRRDEYLQAVRIGIEPDRVHLELSLTAGIAVAEAVIREIDLDHDGALSAAEQQAYARRVLGAMTLQLDQAGPLRLDVAASRFPDPTSIRLGDGPIAIQSDIVIPPLTDGRHRLFLKNRNAAPHVAFLANALAPASDRIAVTAQRRSVDQGELTIEFDVGAHPAATAGPPWRWIGIAGGLVVVSLLIGRTRIRRA